MKLAQMLLTSRVNTASRRQGCSGGGVIAPRWDGIWNTGLSDLWALGQKSNENITVGILSLALANWGFNRGGGSQCCDTSEEGRGNRSCRVLYSLCPVTTSLSFNAVIQFRHAHSLLRSNGDWNAGRLEEASIPSPNRVGIARVRGRTNLLSYFGTFWKIQRCERRTKLLISVSFLLRVGR